MMQPNETDTQTEPETKVKAGSQEQTTTFTSNNGKKCTNKNDIELNRLRWIVFEHCLTDLDNLMFNYDLNGNNTAKRGEYEAKVIELRKKENKPEDLSWNDLFEIELLISNLLPLARLSRHVWQLRLRYRDVVGLSQYEAYLSSKPPELAPTKVEASDYKADVEYMLTEIYVRYMLTPENEKLRDNISTRVTQTIIIGLVIVVIAAAVFSYLQNKIVALGPINLLLVLFIGAMGGLCSMQQRYQTTPRDGDPVDNVLLLQQSWSRLYMPAISGAIFAALLYFIIIGGLVQGQLFPEILSASDPKSNGKEMLDAISTSMPCSISDYAKLVIWSFLAGFAERLVPDTLTRFMSTKEAGPKMGK